MKISLTSKIIIASLVFIGLLISLYFSVYFFINFGFNSLFAGFLKVTFPVLILIILLQLVAHLLRAYKSTILINPIRETSYLILFKYLSIGFLYNTIFPFRLGEIIRAHLAGRDLHISRVVFFFTILFERAIDVFVILFLLIFLLILSKSNLFLTIVVSLIPFLIVIFILSIIILLFIYLSYTENKLFLKFIFNVTEIFNNKVKNKIRFIIWSLVYGINTIYKKANLIKYLALSLLMWFLYIISIFILAVCLFPNLSITNNMFISLLSYIGVSIPSGPAYIGTYHYYLTSIINNIVTTKEFVLSYSVLSWFILILPISLIGILYLFRKRYLQKKTDLIDSNNFREHNSDYINKLSRYIDISSEMSYFLDAYFKNLEVVKIVNNKEMADKIKLLKTFKGGSNAVTVLVWKNGIECVSKITLLQHATKLEEQYNWIKKREHLSNIPKIIGFDKDDESYSIDIAYNKAYIPFFDYIHSNEIQISKSLLSKVVNFVNDNIYINKEEIKSKDDLDHYIRTKIFDKINDCLVLNNQIPLIIDKESIVINGRFYDNFYVIMNKITSNVKIMESLSVYNKCDLHGDLTIDNIIVNNNDFILLDPNNENYISDPLVDYAKLYQSLHSGYEFLCLLEHVTLKNNEIYFDENISLKYSELFIHLEKILSEHLSNDRLKLIKFHEAIHYFRMLTYRAKINPETFLAFYAIAIRLLNEFYFDYEKDF